MSSARLLFALRRVLCDEHSVGLTILYNRVDEGGFAALRALHRQLDMAVTDAYGWDRRLVDDKKTRNQTLYELNGKIVRGEVGYEPY